MGVMKARGWFPDGYLPPFMFRTVGGAFENAAPGPRLETDVEVAPACHH